jgi:SAM-dependent methyltransferase
MERAVYDRMAELDQQHWWFTARRKILASVIRRIARPPRDADILEIGCGTGHNLDMLGGFGRIEACEYDDHARALAERRIGKPIAKVCLPDLSAYDEGRFDLIALLDVLEHVDADAATLAAIRSRLRPGGALLLTVPINPWMWSAHDVSHHHKRRYRPRDVKAMLRAAGFDIQLCSPFNTLLYPAVAAARVAGKAMGREQADDAMPGKGVNALLGSIFGLEAGIIGRVPMPFGVSLVAVARRPDGA